MIRRERQKSIRNYGKEPKVTIWRQTVWLMEKGKSSTIYILHEVARNVEDRQPIPS